MEQEKVKRRVGNNKSFFICVVRQFVVERKSKPIEFNELQGSFTSYVSGA